MKIKFIESPNGREHKKGDIVDFKGRVEETYALKYIARGWAEPVDEAAIRAAEKAEKEEKERTDAEAKAKAESDAKTKADAGARAKNGQPDLK